MMREDLRWTILLSLVMMCIPQKFSLSEPLILKRVKEQTPTLIVRVSKTIDYTWDETLSYMELGT